MAAGAAPGAGGGRGRGAPGRKTVQIRVGGRQAVLTLALFEGVEPSALTHAVAAWAGLRSEREFFLTLAGGGDEADEDTVVPLSYAVPDGAVLRLQRMQRPHHSPHVGFAKPGETTSAALSCMEEGRRGSKSRASSQASPITSVRKLTDSPPSSLEPMRRGLTEPTRPRASPPEAPLQSALRSSSAGGGRPSRLEGAEAPLLEQVPAQRSRARIDAPPTPTRRGLPATPTSPSPRTRRAWSFGLRSSHEGSHGSLSTLSDSCELPHGQSDTFMSVAMVNAMERFSRLSTELANERTLLAYVRTSLAAIRTAFTYLDLTAPGVFWQPSVLLTEFLVAAVMLISTFTGVSRYFRLKAVIERKIPPRHFGRLSLRPLSALLIVACAVTAAGIYSQTWQHGR